jgi:hypothetical protein
MSQGTGGTSMKLAISLVVVYGLVFHTTMTVVIVVALAVIKAMK